MIIDEQGMYKMKGKRETDHNTITTSFHVPKNHKPIVVKNSTWRLNAPEQNWKNFSNNLTLLSTKMNDIFSTNDPIDTTYNRWLKRVENTARTDIGRTTVRTTVKTERFSDTVKELRKTKREMKKLLKGPTEMRTEKIKQFKEIQEQIRTQITYERTAKIQARLDKLSQDQTRNTFWRKRKKLMHEPIKNNLTIKDEEGNRQYSPTKIKETMANYYENLYKKKDSRWHPIHDEIK